MAEELLLTQSDDDLEVVALRPARVWGPDDVDGIARLAQAARGGTFQLYDGGRNIVATTHIDNLVQAALAAADADAAAARAYYITDGEFLEARELFGKLFAALALPPPASGSFALAWLRAELRQRFGADGGAAKLELLRAGQSALFDLARGPTIPATRRACPWIRSSPSYAPGSRRREESTPDCPREAAPVRGGRGRPGPGGRR